MLHQALHGYITKLLTHIIDSSSYHLPSMRSKKLNMARLETLLMLTVLVLQSSRVVCITEGDCPTDEGWTWFDGTSSCYFMTSYGSQFEGKTWCQEKSATMTSILSETENQFLHTLLVDSSTSWVYIGLERAANEPWQWHDGQSYDFEKWTSGVPGGSIDYPACAELRGFDGDWQFFNFVWGQPSICKKSCFNDADCGVHGTCSTGAGHCVCASKFKGPHCETFINPSPRARDHEAPWDPKLRRREGEAPISPGAREFRRKDKEAAGQQ